MDLFKILLFNSPCNSPLLVRDTAPKYAFKKQMNLEAESGKFLLLAFSLGNKTLAFKAHGQHIQMQSNSMK